MVHVQHAQGGRHSSNDGRSRAASSVHSLQQQAASTDSHSSRSLPVAQLAQKVGDAGAAAAAPGHLQLRMLGHVVDVAHADLACARQGEWLARESGGAACHMRQQPARLAALCTIPGRTTSLPLGVCDLQPNPPVCRPRSASPAAAAPAAQPREHSHRSGCGATGGTCSCGPSWPGPGQSPAGGVGARCGCRAELGWVWLSSTRHALAQAYSAGQSTCGAP